MGDVIVSWYSYSHAQQILKDEYEMPNSPQSLVRYRAVQFFDDVFYLGVSTKTCCLYSCFGTQDENFVLVPFDVLRSSRHYVGVMMQTEDHVLDKLSFFSPTGVLV